MTVDLRSLPDPLPIEPLAGPLHATVEVPGSKSITNRALVCAALAHGTSVLEGALHAEDTEAMVHGLQAMGVEIHTDWPNGRVTVTGVAGRPPSPLSLVDARLSGTTSRFLLPVAGLGDGTTRVDGALPLRNRPMGPVVAALRRLGAEVREVGAADHLPIEVSGGPMAGGVVELPGDTSSQFLSGLLLAGPAMRTGLTVVCTTELVSRGYVDMTVAVMAAFGVEVDQPDDRTWVVAPDDYQGTTYRVEPDASAASYAFAAAALAGGAVTVAGLGTPSLQGDLEFVEHLRRMGAEVERAADRTTVRRTGPLVGIDEDLSQESDIAQTLAVVATAATTPTRVNGIGFIRAKETDRVGNVVLELRRLGIEAVEEPDGYVVHPGTPQPGTVATYEDHRMAMAFALLGLVAPGIAIDDPGCVAKTFPGYWDLLGQLRAQSGPANVQPS
ncbi:MAG: 3-phosphoshikimate 1-carboxyvinyltransferase [Actinomycetota bacterium]|nr:3-phosphoshikimate 1-carboxyvinyltransferase [Actinomycetota bacterium]